MRRQVKSEYLFISSFISLRKGYTYIMKNKFNKIDEEIILNYVVKNRRLRK